MGLERREIFELSRPRSDRERPLPLRVTARVWGRSEFEQRGPICVGGSTGKARVESMRCVHLLLLLAKQLASSTTASYCTYRLYALLMALHLSARPPRRVFRAGTEVSEASSRDKAAVAVGQRVRREHSNGS